MNLNTLTPPLTDYRPVVTVVADGQPGGLDNAATVHCLHTTPDAMPAFAPLLQEAGFAADLLIVDARNSSDPAAELAAALNLMSAHGEGLILTHAPVWSDRVWGRIKITGESLVANYFAKARQPGCFQATAGSPDELADTVRSLKRDRLLWRRGAETRPYLQTAGSVIAWDAARGELAGRAADGRGRHNLALHRAGGRDVVAVHLTPFDRCSRRLEAALGTLLALNGKDLRTILFRRPLRQALARALQTEAVRTDPALAAAYQSGLRAAISQVRALRAGIPATALPDGLHAELRPYQKDGFDFLCHLGRTAAGGVLADDMGLGKTLQTLAWLLWLKQGAGAGRGATGAEAKSPKPAAPSLPSLVVCPASVMHNWRREAEKFTPGLKVLVLESGAGRKARLAKLADGRSGFDLVITNYALVRRDLAALLRPAYDALVLDEAQFIKNPAAQIARAVKTLGARAGHRLALTGTPLENRLLDLWSIVDFAAPGHLGTQQEFKDDGGTPAELKKKLRPVLLRRLKTQVAQDLPARIELRRDCSLGAAQMAFYRQELSRSRKEVMSAVNEKGLKQSKLHILAALMRLRQICCHPGLVDGGRHTLASGKTETFFELLDDLRAAGKKVLVFSQFTKMLGVLQAECRRRGIPTHLLTGETTNRQAVVDAFNTPSGGAPSVFLLSLRAAGTGLNLTAASEVILYDPWWNPAVEAQAIDRSHRIGQTRTVNAHRLITRGTIEERIWTIQQAKARTIEAVLGEGGFTRSLTRTDLEYLFGGVEDETAAPHGETVDPKIETLPDESETMIPRHESNRRGRRNTRGHAVPTRPALPLWRLRRSPVRLLPLWRANYGLIN